MNYLIYKHHQEQKGFGDLGGNHDPHKKIFNKCVNHGGNISLGVRLSGSQTRRNRMR